MGDWQIETAERLASIESSLKYIESNIYKLPPSPQCVETHVKLEKRIEELEDFKRYILIRVAWISGAFAAIASGLVSAFDTIKDSFFKIH